MSCNRRPTAKNHVQGAIINCKVALHFSLHHHLSVANFQDDPPLIHAIYSFVIVSIRSATLGPRS